MTDSSRRTAVGNAQDVELRLVAVERRLAMLGISGGGDVPLASKTEAGKIQLASEDDLTFGADPKNDTRATTPAVVHAGLLNHIAARHGYARYVGDATGSNDLNTVWQTGFYSVTAGAANLPPVISSANRHAIVHVAIGKDIGGAGEQAGGLQLAWEIDVASNAPVASWMRFGVGSYWGSWKTLAASDWADLSGKPLTFPPSAHTHTPGEILNLGDAIGDEIAARIVAATDTQSGLVELATNAETQAGTDSSRAVTPAGLASRTATTSRTGIVELATNAEAQIGRAHV